MASWDWLILRERGAGAHGVYGRVIEILFDRSLLLKQLNDINSIDSLEAVKNLKFVGLLNVMRILLSWYSYRKHSQLAIRGTIVDGKWIVDPLAVKSVFLKNAGLFSGISIYSSLTLSQLFFTSDAIFVGKWDSLNIRTIVNVLKCFHLASGLKINFHKSKLMGIGTRLEEVDATATPIGCLIFTTPFVHLGVKVWSFEATSKFSIKSVQHIDDSILLKEEVPTSWVKVMPIKINVFAWRVRLDKLPTRLNLSIIGIDISTFVCPLYHASIESGSHIFFSCALRFLSG
nr:reverse transcriptase zinc-binding domain-containing protein [Tanacetum cinerariifolium]